MRLRGRETQVVVDPEDGGRPLGRPGPDLIVRTRGATDPTRLRPRPGEPQEVSGPGEYELRGIRIHGLPASAESTVMQVEIDEINVVALGRLGRPLTEDEIESLGRVDLLLLPVGATEALAPSAATRLVNTIVPAVVVPAGHEAGELPGTGGSPVELFAKEMGLADGWSLQPRLSLSPSSVAAEETRVVILDPR